MAHQPPQRGFAKSKQFRFYKASILCDDDVQVVGQDSTGATVGSLDHGWMLQFQSPTESEWFTYAVLVPTDGFLHIVHAAESGIRKTGS